MAFRVSRRSLVSLLAIAIPTIYVGRKIRLLAAGPTGAKDCGPSIGEGAATAITGDGANLPWSARGGTTNDVSCLSRTPVHGVIRISSEKDIADALSYARANGIKISMAGARHSMGGQAFARGGIVLDMTGFNGIVLNETARTAIVQSGVRWHDLQNALHPRYAVKAMQSSDVFTVGGSISVNAHGMDHQVGAIERTIRAMRIMLADGTIVTASRNENADLYRHVVGGYGLFGIILDAELEIADNTIYRSARRIIDYRQFAEVFAKEIEPDPSIGLFYGHLSAAPGETFLRELILYSYHDAPIKDVTPPPLAEISSVGLRRLIFNLAKQGDIFARFKWYAEGKLEPRFESCTISRQVAQAEGDRCLVSRNEPMHDSVPYLFNALDYETDILHEYFVPRDRLTGFIDDMRDLMERDRTKLLNASVRVVHKEEIALNYAPEDAFSVVLYINQKVDAAGNDKMRKLTSAFIDLADRHGGRFFLPYQIHYSASQLTRSYPQIGAVFAAKRRYDPQDLFSNRLYELFAAQV